jgi:hypothetical protein
MYLPSIRQYHLPTCLTLVSHHQATNTLWVTCLQKGKRLYTRYLVYMYCSKTNLHTSFTRVHFKILKLLVSFVKLLCLFVKLMQLYYVVVKLRYLRLGKEIYWRYWRTGYRGEYLELKVMKWQKAGGNCMISISIIYTFHQKWLGWSN